MTETLDLNSPFNWRGKPSIFATCKEHNGINTGKAARAALASGSKLYLRGSNVHLEIPKNQTFVYSKAR